MRAPERAAASSTPRRGAPCAPARRRRPGGVEPGGVAASWDSLMARWWEGGWLLDPDDAADAVAEPSPTPDAWRLAEEVGGRVVRLRSLPPGYRGLDDHRPDGFRIPIDPGPSGVESVLVEAALDGAARPEPVALIGPVAFLLAARRRRAWSDGSRGAVPAPGPTMYAAEVTQRPAGRLDPVRIATWLGGAALCAGGWATLGLLLTRMVG